MKKILFLFSAVIMMALVSCGSSKEAETIYNKIQQGEEISQEDCHYMIEYLEKPLTESVKIISETQDINEIQEKLTKIGEKYPYVQPFSQYLASHYYDLDAENQEEFGEVSQKLQNMLR